MKKVIAVIGFMFPAMTFAASFDCSKAGTPIEKAICSYPELSALDEQLASVYRVAATKAADQSLDVGLVLFHAVAGDSLADFT